MTRTSTCSVRSAPSGSISRSCRTRSSLACKAWLIVPISSRKMEPPLASENLPRLVVDASVNAPLTCPNSSDSSSVSGMAAQFTLMNGLLWRAPRLWSARATSSLPVPVSPVIRTVLGASATCSIRLITSAIARLRPTISPPLRFLSIIASSPSASLARPPPSRVVSVASEIRDAGREPDAAPAAANQQHRAGTLVRRRIQRVVDDEIAIRGERDARGIVLRERQPSFTDQRCEDTGIGVRPDAVAAGEQQPVPLDEDVSVGLDYGVQIRDSPRAGR